MALLFAEHANEPVDISRVVKMLLLHDVVEIDAGDTFVYDAAASEQQAEKSWLRRGVCLECCLTISAMSSQRCGMSLKRRKVQRPNLLKRWIG